MINNAYISKAVQINRLWTWDLEYKDTLYKEITDPYLKTDVNFANLKEDPGSSYFMSDSL